MNRSIRVMQCLVTLVALAASTPARAEGEIGLGVKYDPRLPLGGLHDLVPGIGFSGAQARWEYYLRQRELAVGFDVQYHRFDHSAEPTTIAIPNGAATAPFTRSAWFLAVLPTVRWFPASSTLRVVRPYVELGVGVTSATSSVIVADLERHENTGGLIVQPSLGIVWSLVSTEKEGPPRVTTGESSDAGYYSYAAPGTSTRRLRESMFGIIMSGTWAFTTADVVTATNVSTIGAQVGIYTKL